MKWLSVAALLRYGAIIGQGREHPSVMTGGSPGGERSGNRATRCAGRFFFFFFFLGGGGGGGGVGFF